MLLICIVSYIRDYKSEPAGVCSTKTLKWSYAKDV